MEEAVSSLPSLEVLMISEAIGGSQWEQVSRAFFLGLNSDESHRLWMRWVDDSDREMLEDSCHEDFG